MKSSRFLSPSVAALITVVLLSYSLPASGIDDKPSEVLVSVSINGREVSDFEYALKDNVHWYLTVAFLRESRISLPKGIPLVYKNREYYSLDTILGLTFTTNLQAQTLSINVPPSAFDHIQFDALKRIPTHPTLPPPGYFLNHDFQYSRSSSDNLFSGLVEGGMFGPFGFINTNFSVLKSSNGFSLTRIATSYIHDLPSKLSTFTIGDSITPGEMWGRSVYFAGVSYGSNFAVQPSFIPQSLPSASGVADAPSVVNIYSDNLKLLSQPVDSGPFAIQNIPVMTGQGNIQLVITDALGRSQTITQPFIKSDDLLRQGVRDFSYTLGAFRSNYGYTNGQYRSLFFAGNERRGLSDSLSVGGRLELVGKQQALGGSATKGLTGIGVIGGGTVLSFNDGRPGNLYYVDFTRQNKFLSFGIHYESATRNFWQIGILKSESNGRHLIQASTNIALGNRASISFGGIQQVVHGSGDLRSLTATLGIRVGPGYFTATPTISTVPTRSSGVNFSFSFPFGKRGLAISSANTGNAGRSAYTEVQRVLPVGTGYGYRVRTDELNQGHVDIDYSYQNERGQWDAEASQGNHGTSYRLSERSSIVLFDRHLKTSRWLNDSFALVEVPHQPNIDVLVNHQKVGHTDRNGVALVTWMAAYSRNSITVDDSSLSMDTILDISERIVVPMYRSGILVQYKQQHLGGALVLLSTVSRGEIPPGATVKIGGIVQAQVALHSVVYLPSFNIPAELLVEWPGHSCKASIRELPAGVIPKIGPFPCAE